MSNSTLQRFSGAAKKSWMTGAATDTSPHAPWPLQTGSIYKSPWRPSESNTDPRRNVASTVQRSDVSASTPPQTDPAGQSTRRISWPRGNVGTPTTTNIIDLLAEGDCNTEEQATVLPSPAPSEDAPQSPVAPVPENAAVARPSQPTTYPTAQVRSAPSENPISAQPSLPTSSAGTVAQNPLPAAAVASSTTSASATANPENQRLRELAARYGGIDELERQLGLSERAANSVHSNPQSPVVLQSPAQGAGAFSPRSQSARNVTSMSSLPASRADPMQVTSGAPSVAVPRLQDTLPQTAMPSSTALSRPASPQINYERLLGSINDRRAWLVHSTGMSSSEKCLEDSRLTLLAEACKTKDWFYLVLHQLFCLFQLPGMSDFWCFQAEEKGGLESLNALLVANACLNQSSVEWFAQFPRIIARSQQAISSAFGCTRNCLKGLAMQWEAFSRQHKANMVPPHVDDILRYLMVDSTVLQRVIFKSIYRSVWTGPEDKCFDESVRIFESTQEDFSLWRRQYNSTTLSDSFRAWHQTLLLRYRSLQRVHYRHTNTMPNPSDANARGSFTVVQHPPRLPNTPPAFDSQVATVNHPTRTQSPRTLESHPRRTVTIVPTSNMNAQNPTIAFHQNQGLGLSMPQRQNSSPAVFPPNNPAQLPSTMNGQGRGQWMPTFPPQQATNMRHLPQYANNVANANQRGSSSTMPGGVVRPLPNQQQPIQQPVRSQNAAGSVQRATTQHFENENFFWTQQIMQNLAAQQSLPLMAPNGSYNFNPPLFPPVLAGTPQPSQQNFPLGMPLHQAYWRDALSLPSMTSQPGGGMNYLGYFKSFLQHPHTIRPTTQNARVRFEVNEELFSTLPNSKYDVFGGPPVRELKSTSQLLRVRTIRKHGVAATEASWAVTETEWPNSMVILLNDREMPIRRKAEWGKDMAVDITSHVKQGENYMRASFLRTPRNAARTPQYEYELAVEILSIVDQDSISESVQTLPSSETHERILRQLNSTDDEIEIVSSDLVVRVADPFSAQLLTKPVRGKGCLHYECFDQDIFVSTRKKMVLLPEQFRCPICGGDARPTSLRLDGWFVEVLKKIREGGREDAKAIVVDKSGGWKVKEEEKEGEGGDGSVAAKLEDKNDTPGQARRDSNVIEID